MSPSNGPCEGIVDGHLNQSCNGQMYLWHGDWGGCGEVAFSLMSQTVQQFYPIGLSQLDQQNILPGQFLISASLSEQSSAAREDNWFSDLPLSRV